LSKVFGKKRGSKWQEAFSTWQLAVIGTGSRILPIKINKYSKKLMSCSRLFKGV
jgi:hypothetical protein